MTPDHAITLCAMTLRHASLPERLRAAAEAGFDSVGFTLDQYRAARADGLTDAALRRLLGAHGLRVAELESPWDWAAAGSGSGVVGQDEEADLLLHALEALECGQLNAVQFTAYPDELLAERLAALAERVAASGARVALEFMPFSEIRTLGHAWRLVRDSGAPAAGLLLDHWHYRRSGATPADLAAIPPERVLSVQLNDVRPTPGDDLRYEARHLRLLPGAGAAAFVRELDALGVTARMSAEIWADDLDLLPPAEAAGQIHGATIRTLAAAGHHPYHEAKEPA
ncbi:sugar phosphate isomerase/epimerase family protein [Nonomuraea sp. NPDC002799]